MSLVSEEHIELYGGKYLFRPSLYSLRDRKDLVGAEVGVASGHNAKTILNNLDIKKLYLIDSYQLYDGYMNKGVGQEKRAHSNLKKWESKTKWIKQYSDIAAERIEDGELDFAYVDANHYYKYVIEDLKLWYPKVKRDGIIAGHDYQYTDVRQAVNKFFDERRKNRHVHSAICRIEQRGKHQLVWIDWWVFKTVYLHNKMNKL